MIRQLQRFFGEIPKYQNIEFSDFFLNRIMFQDLIRVGKKCNFLLTSDSHFNETMAN